MEGDKEEERRRESKTSRLGQIEGRRERKKGKKVGGRKEWRGR